MPFLPFRRRAFALWVAVLAGAAQGAEVEGFHFSHHDWEVACDNSRTCRAAGYQADDAEFPVSVLLSRKGGPGTPVEGQLQLGSLEDAVPDGEGGSVALQLEIAGTAVGAVEVPLTTLIADLPAPLAAALLDALPGTTTLAFVGRARTWELSNRGAAAVLLKMDEFQGRLDTPGALRRKGSRDESTVPAALPPPEVRVVAIDGSELPELAADPALRAALQASDTGDTCEAELVAEGDLYVQRIDATRALASLPCWRGAYNFGSAHWVIAVSPPFAPQLVTTSASDGMDELLVASHKGRGIGDCWSSESWRWDGERFVRTAASTSGMCKLVAAGGAWELPTLVSTVIEPTPRD